jgi:hypothetical protein
LGSAMQNKIDEKDERQRKHQGFNERNEQTMAA